jgi:hypothetical protein
LDDSFIDNKFKNYTLLNGPINRADNLFFRFNDADAEEFVYGIKSEQAIIIAYDSLLFSDDYWEKIIIYGVFGITDNSVMGSLCGILFGIECGINNSINKVIFKDEPWIKKILVLGKNIN